MIEGSGAVLDRSTIGQSASGGNPLAGSWFSVGGFCARIATIRSIFRRTAAIFKSILRSIDQIVFITTKLLKYATIDPGTVGDPSSILLRIPDANNLSTLLFQVGLQATLHVAIASIITLIASLSVRHHTGNRK
jgi:hypothetical protein